MLDWLKKRTRDESGVILVVVAGAMVLIIAAAAVAIDVGSFYKDQRRAQAAADAAALAASQDLPASNAAAQSDGTNYGTTNYPGASVTVTPDYNNVPGDVKATVTAQSPAFFGQLFGLTSATVGASAVAGGNGSQAPAAIFAYDANCSNSDVTLNGNATAINGSVISNGTINYNGNPSSVVSTGTYGGPNGCQYNNTNKGTFTSGPTENPALTPFPVDYSGDVPTCTVTATNLDWSKGTKQISGGTSTSPIVYCADTITLDGNNLTGSNIVFIANTISITGEHPTLTNVSFIGSNITVTSNNFTATAPSDGLLFYDQSSTTMVLGGTNNSLNFTGAIYAPTATVEFQGNSVTGTGLIEGQDVTANANSFNVTGTGPEMGGNGNSLIQ